MMRTIFNKKTSSQVRYEDASLLKTRLAISRKSILAAFRIAYLFCVIAFNLCGFLSMIDIWLELFCLTQALHFYAILILHRIFFHDTVTRF